MTPQLTWKRICTKRALISAGFWLFTSHTEVVIYFLHTLSPITALSLTHTHTHTQNSTKVIPLCLDLSNLNWHPASLKHFLLQPNTLSTPLWAGANLSGPAETCGGWARDKSLIHQTSSDSHRCADTTTSAADQPLRRGRRGSSLSSTRDRGDAPAEGSAVSEMIESRTRRARSVISEVQYR